MATETKPRSLTNSQIKAAKDLIISTKGVIVRYRNCLTYKYDTTTKSGKLLHRFFNNDVCSEVFYVDLKENVVYSCPVSGKLIPTEKLYEIIHSHK